MTNREACMGFFAGAMVGAAIAMLYAPASGSDTRRRLRSAGHDLREKAMEQANEITHTAGEKLAGAKATVQDKVNQTVDKLNTEATRVAAAVRDGKEALQASYAARG
ncbi:hypothetical protein F183_A18670 [Bryobacterales bacterium F-183]|nr:hypothetical protein F183_A18670 [Bryobacterales bacterium F-183]